MTTYSQKHNNISGAELFNGYPTRISPAIYSQEVAGESSGICLRVSRVSAPSALEGEMRMIEEKVKRNVFEVADMHASDDTAYWRDRSYIERIETIEFLRKVMFGHDRVSERLQRILTIAELKEN